MAMYLGSAHLKAPPNRQTNIYIDVEEARQNTHITQGSTLCLKFSAVNDVCVM